jgi:pimeloyl-ACP methyl ester carboxylesterase
VTDRAEVEPFEVHVPDAVLDDLTDRLRRFRTTPDFANDDWSYGFNGEFLAKLRRYWLEGYDWRSQEERINAWPQYMATVDGLPIHFVHVRGKGPSPVPLVLTGGWPWTFWDFHKVLAPLTDPAAHGGDPADSFDVVVPSMPGFGFSSPVSRPGLNYWTVADLWVTLMSDVLGYERFAAHGADIGSLVTAQLGHKYADHLVGIHCCGALTLGSWATDRAWSSLLGTLAERAPADLREQVVAWEKDRASHLTVQVIEPQTLAYAMNDSPVGLAAWILERRRSWSDCGGDIESVFSLEDLTTTAMIYWVTGTFASAARYYADATRNRWSPAHDGSPVVPAPTGVSLFAANNPPGYDSGWIGTYYNLVFQRDHPTGGHFPPLEQPKTLVDDLRAMFRPLRS